MPNTEDEYTEITKHCGERAQHERHGWEDENENDKICPGLALPAGTFTESDEWFKAAHDMYPGLHPANAWVRLRIDLEHRAPTDEELAAACAIDPIGGLGTGELEGFDVDEPNVHRFRILDPIDMSGWEPPTYDNYVIPWSQGGSNGHTAFAACSACGAFVESTVRHTEYHRNLVETIATLSNAVRDLGALPFSRVSLGGRVDGT